MIIERRMTRNPVTATPDMSIADASNLMRQEKVHRLPVLDKDKRLVGLITEKDILFAASPFMRWRICSANLQSRN
jgi:acetoin utilization protein AcuB